MSRMCLSGVLAMVVGCGGGTLAPVTRTPVAANLNGNWLLVGALPFSPPFGSPQNLSPGFAGTFAITGQNVEAVLTAHYTCSGFIGSSSDLIVTGTVDGSGSFTLVTPAIIPQFATATVTGSVPGNGATGWSGHITFSNGSGSSCPFSQSMDFQAVRIADLTGTYSGTGTIQSTSLTAPKTQPVTLTLTVQQGTSLPMVGESGVQTTNEVGLSGSLQVTGSSCASAGTLVIGSGVLAPEATMRLAMSDGSTAISDAQILDQAALHLSFGPAFWNSAACGPVVLSQTTLTRQ